MDSLSATIKAGVSVQTGKNRDLGTVPYSLNISAVKKFSLGSGALKASKQYDDKITIADDDTTTLDLSVLGANALGEATAITKLKVLFIENLSSTRIVTVTPNAVNGWDAAFTDITIKPGGVVLIVAPDAGGYTVDGTHKALDFTNEAGGTTDVNIAMLGE